MTHRRNHPAVLIDMTAEGLQFLVVRKIPDHAMAARVINGDVVIRVDLIGLERRAQPVHEGLVVIPLPVNRRRHVGGKAVGVDRRVPTLRADIIDGIACGLDLVHKMHRLPQP